MINKRVLLALALACAMPAFAQEAPPPSNPAAAIAPDARATLDRMNAALARLDAFSVEARSTRDEVLGYGYKLQNHETASLTVKRPNMLRSEIRGDLVDRTIVFNSGKLTLFSVDDNAYVQVQTVPTLDRLLTGLLDAGVEMPMIDVLRQSLEGSLTEGVVNGILVGDSVVDGVACDHLAFRQADVDWQLWVQKGENALPRKIVITSRFTVGDPQFSMVMDWNLRPNINASTFAFAPPKDAVQIPLANESDLNAGAK